MSRDLVVANANTERQSNYLQVVEHHGLEMLEARTTSFGTHPERRHRQVNGHSGIMLFPAGEHRTPVMRQPQPNGRLVGALPGPLRYGRHSLVSAA